MSLTDTEIQNMQINKLDNIPLKSNAFENFTGYFDTELDMNNNRVTEHLVDMSSMFRNANNFNQTINNWNVSNVTNMQSMFHGASSFNQPINNWNVSNVTNMTNMFNGATSFNQDVSEWSFNPYISLNNFLSGVENYSAIYFSRLLYTLYLNRDTFNGIIQIDTSSNMTYYAKAYHDFLESVYGWIINFTDIIKLNHIVNQCFVQYSIDFDSSYDASEFNDDLNRIVTDNDIFDPSLSLSDVTIIGLGVINMNIVLLVSLILIY